MDVSMNTLAELLLATLPGSVMVGPVEPVGNK